MDTSFGSGGFVVTDLGGPTYSEDYARDVATDPSGRVVVAGASEYSGQTKSDAIVVRYTQSGRLDPSFGNGGVVRLHFGAGSFDSLAGLVIDASGRIVVAGTTASDIACTTYCHPVVARLTDSGQLDPTFSGDGSVTITGNQYERGAGSVAIDAGGRILVACGPSVYRLTSTGGFDPTFGSLGRAAVQEAYYDVTADSVGRIVVAGDYYVKRLLSDGQLDTSFGPYDDSAAAERPTPSGTNPYVYAVAVDSLDRVIAGGISYSESGAPFRHQPFVVRYTPGGMLDKTFGQDGVVLSEGEGMVFDLAVDHAGRYLALGYVNELGSSVNFAMRYLANGSVDTSFGGGLGFARLPFYARDIAVDASQRIVVAGVGPEDIDLAVARYFGDLAVDPSPTEPESPVPPTPPTSPASSAPTSPPGGSVQPTKAKPKPKAVTVRCRKGFRKKRIRGKVRCVKQKKGKTTRRTNADRG